MKILVFRFEGPISNNKEKFALSLSGETAIKTSFYRKMKYNMFDIETGKWMRNGQKRSPPPLNLILSGMTHEGKTRKFQN